MYPLQGRLIARCRRKPAPQGNALGCFSNPVVPASSGALTKRRPWLLDETSMWLRMLLALTLGFESTIGESMTISRRQLFQSLALAGGYSAAAAGAEPTITLDALRNVSVAHGTNLSDERLGVIKPVLEHRLPQLRTLREFEVDDTIAPTQGILA